jgi:hypothetical protein
MTIKHGKTQCIAVADDLVLPKFLLDQVEEADASYCAKHTTKCQQFLQLALDRVSRNCAKDCSAEHDSKEHGHKTLFQISHSKT